jgi:hypothetical protein
MSQRREMDTAKVTAKSVAAKVFELIMTSLVDMTTFKLYLLKAKFKHSRCHDGKFLQVLPPDALAHRRGRRPFCHLIQNFSFLPTLTP